MRGIGTRQRPLLKAVCLVHFLFGIPSHGAEQTLQWLRRRSVVEDTNIDWDFTKTVTRHLADGDEEATGADVHHQAVHAEDKSPELTIQTVGAASASLPEKLMEMSDNIFVQQCMSLLESQAQNNTLNRQQYVTFLKSMSNDTLAAQDFATLPLFLAMIFFSASCSSGEDCVTREPLISIAPLGTKQNRMTQVLCQQLMRFPFLEILLPFQFLLRADNGLSASELLLLSEQADNRVEDENTKIISKIEGALDHVLLKGFNCSYVPREPSQMSRGKVPPHKRSQFRQPQPHGECDFVVQVTVEDAADYPCGFQNNCILIFSDVSVFAVLKDTLDEPKLRKITTDVLRGAINGNTLHEFL